MKMRYFVVFVMVAALAGCRNNSVTMSGKLEKPEPGEYIVLSEILGTSLKAVDSVKLESDGKFEFKRDIKIPTFFLLRTSRESFITLLMAPGEKLVLNADFYALNMPASVTGSAGTEKMIEYNKVLKSTIDKLNGLREIYNQNADSKELPKLIATLDSTAQSYVKELNLYTKNYIDQNITSLVSLVALYQVVAGNTTVLNPVDDLAWFVKVDSSMMKLYPSSEPVKSLHEQVLAIVESARNKNGAEVLNPAGSDVPDIALPSPTGEIIKLSSTRGKYVLLDFWAAWCGPCRRENPNLLRAYNTYKSKGFQIYQVSLDKNKEEWTKGIEQDMLGQWIHVSDLKYWNSSVVQLYKIESIPHNLLLDRDGKVIATDLRGERLINKLAEVIK